MMAMIAPALAQDMRVVEVSQKDRRFSPSEVTVPANSDIVFLNDDRFTHHVFIENGRDDFDSGAQRPGETVTMTLDRAGLYEFGCAIHPKMRLKVHVTED